MTTADRGLLALAVASALAGCDPHDHDEMPTRAKTLVLEASYGEYDVRVLSNAEEDEVWAEAFVAEQLVGTLHATDEVEDGWQWQDALTGADRLMLIEQADPATLARAAHLAATVASDEAPRLAPICHSGCSGYGCEYLAGGYCFCGCADPEYPPR